MKRIKYIGAAIILGGALSFFVYNTTLIDPPEDNLNIQQMATSAELSPELMQEDIDYLIERIKHVHPKTQDGLTEAQLKVIEGVKKAIETPMSAGEFYFQAAEILNTLKDAHSMIFLDETDDYLGLSFLWLAEGLFVETDSYIAKRGDKVVKIGDFDENELMASLKEIIPAENPYWLRVRGESALIKKTVLQKLGLVTEDDKVCLTLERDGKLIETRIGFSQLYSKPQRTENWIDWTLDEEMEMGYFRLDVCENNDTYQATLDNFFKAVYNRDIRNVVVDLRHNTGGDSSVVDAFFEYVDIDRYETYSGGIRYSEEAKADRGYFQSSGYVKYDENYNDLSHKDVKFPLFDGDLYLLTSNKTFSSANWFGVVVKDNNLGIIVGEPTGNAPNSYGDILLFRLPNSGFMLQLSHKMWYRPDDTADTDALYPDVLVERTMADILDERDVVMEKVKELIKTQESTVSQQ